VSDPTADQFDEQARRAGAELRRPAPADGLGTVEHRLARRRQTRTLGGAVLGLAILGGSFAAIARRHDAPKGLQTSPTTASPFSTTVPTVPTAPSTTLKRTLRLGDTGDDVRALQERLNGLNFDVGPIDGVFGETTQAAVWAYQDFVRDVKASPTRSADGVVTPELWKRLQEPLTISDTATNVTTRHANIYLPSQVMTVWNGPTLKVITHVSTGSGQNWCAGPEDVPPWPGPTTTIAGPKRLQKICGKSMTPGGVFKVYRKIAGKTELPLGTATDPVFFNHGIAIHGFSDVPYNPASHGLVRVPLHIGPKLNEFLQVGDNVLVYDGLQDPAVYGAKPPPDDYLDPTDPAIDPSLDPTVAGLTPTTAKPTTAPALADETDSGISSDLRMTVGQSGRVITFDAPSGKLSFVGGASITVDPSLKAQELDLITVGPDDVAYFFVHAPDTLDPEYNVVVVSMHSSNPGAVVARSPKVVVQDVQLMPTRDGLVDVSTNAAQRPAPTDPLLQHWVDHLGKEITSYTPTLALTGPPEGPLVITRRDGDKVTTFTINDVPPYLYGLPPIVATNDGGIVVFLGATATADSPPSRLLRFAADGHRTAELSVPDQFPVALAADGTVYFERSGTSLAKTYGKLTLPA
jgi:Putative peptidoglycan binding domain